MESSRNSLAGPAGRAVLTAICLLAVLTPSAGAALPFRLSDLFAPRPAPAAAPVIAPVAEPITVDPVGPVQGTMIMVHAGGWAGHDASAQRQLVDSPGDVFLKRGWRIISIDYNEGTAGLQDVLNTAGAELTRKTGDGPVCIYGESSGAHLALAVAARLRAIDCVAGLGTPTDIGLYQQEAAASSDLRVKQVAGRMGDFFGATPDAYASWNPVTFAATIHADMLLLHEADDEVVTALHGQRFQAAAPAPQLAELEPGDPNDETTDFMHGTISEVGRTHYASALGSFCLLYTSPSPRD